MALKALTVSFQEPALLARLNAENRGGDRDLYRGGPLNPQALNRYAYVLNNPVNATDPTGHSVYMTHDQASVAAELLRAAASDVAFWGSMVDAFADKGAAAAGVLAAAYFKQQGATALASLVVGVELTTVFGLLSALYIGGAVYLSDYLNDLAGYIDMMNGPQGVAMRYSIWTVTSDAFIVMNRETGDRIYVGAPVYFGWYVPDNLRSGPIVGNPFEGNFKFKNDLYCEAS